MSYGIDFTPQKFFFEVKGNVTGKTFNGEFTCNPVLGFFQMSQANQDLRSFLGNPKDLASVPEDLYSLGYYLSQIKIRVISGPPWYSESNFLREKFVDINVVSELFNKLSEIENEWYKAIKGEAAEAKKELLAAESKQDAKPTQT